jgi:purine-binding chemotaxis protein CheW
LASNPSQADIQMVTFLLDREEYAVNVMSVREIINMTDITKMANSPSHVEGVINLRGRIVPIISLRKRFAMPELAENDSFFTCIAVMDFAGELTGFIIDEVSDVIRVAGRDILPPLDAAAQPWIEGIVNLDQRMIIVTNLEHLA